MVKNPPDNAEDEMDPVEEETATHSSIIEESYRHGSLVGYHPRGHKESDTTEQLSMHTQANLHFLLLRR